MKTILVAFENLWAPLLGVALSCAVIVLLLLGIGESPAVFWEAVHATLFTGFGLGYTLFYATPLIFTGLSVALSFHCGLFNIGAEGQLYFGALATVVMSTIFPTESIFGVILGIGAAALAGGAWGGLAGFLKAKRGTHEVIATILLNFIALALVDYCILYPLKNPDVQNPETVAVASGYVIPTLEKLGFSFFASTPVNLSLVLAVLGAMAVYFLLNHTRMGFELRSVGKSQTVSRFMGIAVYHRMVLALGLSGAASGLVGVNEVMGHQHRLTEGFSPQYGFTGIAVALLARNHPFAILVSALLFGALHNSARELEFLSEKVTKEISLVIQATLIAFVASDYLPQRVFRRRRG